MGGKRARRTAAMGLGLLLLAACGGGHGPTLFQSAAPGNVPADRIALTPGGGNQYLVPVKVGNQTFNLLLDTGFEAVLVFKDLLAADNTAIQTTGERADIKFGSGPRRGDIATAPVSIGHHSASSARIVLVDSPTSTTDPSLTGKHAQGILGLRFQPGQASLGGATLDPILLKLDPKVHDLEFDLRQSGPSSLSLGGTPVLSAANPSRLFTAQTVTDIGPNRIKENYADLEVPFNIRSSAGIANASYQNILLDTGAASLLVLDVRVAQQIGFDPWTMKWTIPADQPLDLRLVGLKGELPITPAFKVSDVKVTDLGGTTFYAVLGVDRWQSYVIGFSFIDFSLGGPEGTFRFLARDQLAQASQGVTVDTSHLVALPGLNTSAEDGSPSLSADGKLLVFESDRPGGQGLRDIYGYSLVTKSLVDLGALNSANNDETPSVSGDGGLIAFTSDRPGGQGDYDIYLWDVAARAFIPLPGLNTSALERSPSLSADGRYISFRSERGSSSTPSDVYVYDRQTSQLLDTPGLNSTVDEFTSGLSRHAERIVFGSRNRPGDQGDCDIHLYDLGSKAEIPLSSGVNSQGFDEFVGMSAGGRYAAFTTDRAAAVPGGDGRDVAVVDFSQSGTDGKAGVLLTLPGLNSLFEDSSPSLNDDGSLIAFASSRSGGAGGLDIYVYRRQ